MTYLNDEDAAAIREGVHAINNALNVISMQGELVKALARDSSAADRISAAVDTMLEECRKAGDVASGIGSRARKAG